MNEVFENITEFSMNHTMNMDPYCVNALDKELAYLKAFDTDRLLAGFRETAGLDTKGAKRYEGWESTLIGGHTLGHYLSAISQAYANRGVCQTDRDILFEILITLIDGLLECQIHSKGKKNFLFGAVILDSENVELQFDNVEKDLTDITTQAWVPWYTMHKLLAGVLDAYKFVHYENALTVAKQIGDWTYNRVMSWDEATAAQVLRVEYGGMNEVLYELYDITENENYAIAAHYFDSVELFERVNGAEEDVLDNHHANTTIPKFMGALRRYLTCHGKTIGGKTVDAGNYLEYAKKFWDMVVEKHTYVTGGNSEWEHFGKDYILDKERTNCNCETCNVYNMLKFTRTLFCLTGDVKYANYYENAFYNSILSSQNPETGMTTYFQPMATGYFKVFGERFSKFWCCIGTGMENFTKLNDSIYFHSDTHIIVNLYEASSLIWEEKNCKLSMMADLQNTKKVTLVLESTNGQPVSVGMALRIPSWVSETPKLAIDGEDIEYIVENGYALLPPGLMSGSTITFLLPMKVIARPLPDNDRCIAFQYGPTVLSANLGCENMITTTTGVMVTIPAKKVSGYDEILLPDDVSPEEFIQNVDKYMRLDKTSSTLSFELTVNGMRFAPHFSRYKERYGIYFTVRTNAE